MRSAELPRLARWLGDKDPVRAGEVTLLTGSVFRPQKSRAVCSATIKVLVDCSGSMQGDSIAQARDCLGWLFGQLDNNDKVTLTRFGSTVEHKHPQLQSRSAPYKMAVKAAYKVALKSAARNLQADLGGTEIDLALKEVIALDNFEQGESNNAVILLITDGDVWDIEQTITTVRTSGHRIYAVGVGSAPAESLLKEMAEVTGGACELVTPRESMQKAVERLLLQIRKTQGIEHNIRCTAPMLWQSRAVSHAAPGESLITWTQVLSEAAFDVDMSNNSAEDPTTCPVVWESGIELSRIAAAFRLNDTIQSEAREAIALDYQLVTSETNLILVHERAENEKAEHLPELHQVRPMLAAGHGGNGTVTKAHSNRSLAMLRTGCDNAPFISEYRSLSAVSALPAVWRTARTHAAARVDGMAAAGMNDIEIPAFLRKQDDGSATTPTKHPEPKYRPSLPIETSKSPMPSPDDLAAILRLKDSQHNPVTELLHAFNQSESLRVSWRPVGLS